MQIDKREIESQISPWNDQNSPDALIIESYILPCHVAMILKILPCRVAMTVYLVHGAHRYYLTVQMMRFEWNAISNNKAKIIRECQFNLSFDAYDLCSERFFLARFALLRHTSPQCATSPRSFAASVRFISGAF